MYNIYDILEEINFKVVNEDLEMVKMYRSDCIGKRIEFSIYKDNEKIFEYSPNYAERYKGNFNKEAVKATVKEILDDLDREIKEQTGVKYIISEAEKEWKDKYGI